MSARRTLRPTRRLPALLVSAAALVLALGGASLTASGATPPSRIPYTLTVHFDGTAHGVAKMAPYTVSWRSEAAFAGTSRRFWLTGFGTASKPLYTTTWSDGDPAQVPIASSLEYDGGETWEGEQCDYAVTYALRGDPSVTAEFGVESNRVRVGVRTKTNVTIDMHRVGMGQAGCELNDTIPCRDYGRCFPVGDEWGKLDANALKKLRLGRSFSLTLITHIQGPRSATSTSTTTYTWRLEFTRA